MVVLEMILIRKTINLWQAFNPWFSVLMVYKHVGPFIGQYFYEIYDLWDLGPDYHGDAKKTLIYACFLLIMMTTPQLFIKWILSSYYLTHDQIPDVYFEKGLLVREDQRHDQYAKAQVILVISSIVIGVVYALVYSKKR